MGGSVTRAILLEEASAVIGTQKASADDPVGWLGDRLMEELEAAVIGPQLKRTKLGKVLQQSRADRKYPFAPLPFLFYRK